MFTTANRAMNKLFVAYLLEATVFNVLLSDARSFVSCSCFASSTTTSIIVLDGALLHIMGNEREFFYYVCQHHTKQKTYSMHNSVGITYKASSEKLVCGVLPKKSRQIFFAVKFESLVIVCLNIAVSRSPISFSR